MRVLMIGDIMGRPGRRTVERWLPRLRESLAPDLVIANGENAAAGMGLSVPTAKQILAAGVDGITLGNHAFRRRDVIPLLESSPCIIRPANYPDAPGRGVMVLEAAGGGRLAVINLMGTTFMDPLDCPFRAADKLCAGIDGGADAILVDIHAEATSEKMAMAHYLDGRVGAVIGTHTHVATADARILPRGTAYITDIGMTGPHDSILGMKTDVALRRYLTRMPQPLEVAAGGCRLNGVVVDFAADGRASRIERITCDDRDDAVG